jgi:hypothetical protein
MFSPELEVRKATHDTNTELHTYSKDHDLGRIILVAAILRDRDREFSKRPIPFTPSYGFFLLVFLLLVD